MDRKTIALLLICPVLVTGCGEEPPGELFTRTEIPEGRAEAAPAFAVIRPDSSVSALLLSGDSPVRILETCGSEIVEPGDTAALGSDPFLQMETDRITMELEFAIATGDSLSADSLREVLADSSVFVPVLFSVGGRMELRVEPGDEIQPGDTVAVVTGPPPESTFVILPGSGHLRWPETLPGTRLASGGLQVSGTFSGDSARMPGFYSIASHFIHEEGLSTFLVTTEGDTVHVTVTGNANGARIVYSQLSLDSLTLAGWN